MARRRNQPGENAARGATKPRTPEPKKGSRPKKPSGINKGTDSRLRKAVNKRTKM